MLQILAGTAAIAFPQVGAPAVGVLAAVKVAGSLRRRKSNKAVTAQRLKSESVGTIDAQLNRFIQDVVEPVTLEWSDLKLNLKQKDGTEKPILRGVSGVARPGRCVPVKRPDAPRHADARHTPHVHAILHHHHTSSPRSTFNPPPHHIPFANQPSSGNSCLRARSAQAFPSYRSTSPQSTPPACTQGPPSAGLAARIKPSDSIMP